MKKQRQVINIFVLNIYVYYFLFDLYDFFPIENMKSRKGLNDNFFSVFVPLLSLFFKYLKETVLY